MAESPYLYPGTNVLRNLKGIMDQEILATFEADATRSRLVELAENPIRGEFDRTHLLMIHRNIFQDVYDWAGEPRIVDINKVGGSAFLPYDMIDESLNKMGAEIQAENFLRGLDEDEFSLRAGHYLGEINTIHAFREGNGRTQREFIRELGEAAGHEIRWGTALEPLFEHMFIQAHRDSLEKYDTSGLAAIISLSLAPEEDRMPPRKQERGLGR